MAELEFFNTIMSSIATQIREKHGLDDTHKYTVTSMISAIMDLQRTDDYTSISKYMCKTLNTYTIPAYASCIGDYAFYGFGGLSSISKARNLSYGYHSFENCNESGAPSDYVSDVSGIYNKGTTAPARLTNGSYQGTLVDPAVNTAIRTASYRTADAQFSGLANAMRALIPQIKTYQLSLKAISGYISWITSGDHNDYMARIIDRSITSLILSSNMYDGWLHPNTFRGCTSLVTLALHRSGYIESGALAGCSRLHLYCQDSTLFHDEAINPSDINTSSGIWCTYIGAKLTESLVYNRVYTTGYDESGFKQTSTKSFVISSGADSIIRYGFNQDGYAQGGFYSTEGTDGIGVSGVDFHNVSFIGNKAFANITNRDDAELKWVDLTSGTTGLLIVDDEAFAGNPMSSAYLGLGIGFDMAWPIIELMNGVFEQTSLTYLDISDNVSLHGSGIFAGCESLRQVYLDTGVFTSSAPAGTFSSCVKLSSMVISGYGKTIGGSICYACSKLKTVSLPNSISMIEEYAFCDCISLGNINWPTGLTTIGPEAFWGCSKLSGTVNLSSTALTTIYEGAFRATNISRLILPATVTHVDSSAFYGMPGNTKISCYFPKSVVSYNGGYQLNDINPDDQLVFIT